MNWRTLSPNPGLPAPANKLALSLAVFISLYFFCLPYAVFAECCVCTDPQITNGLFCLKKNTATKCETINSLNTELKTANCRLETQAVKCRQTGSGGLCLNDPNTDASTFKLASIKPSISNTKSTAPKTSGAGGFTSSNFKLNVDIPGVKFSDPYLKSEGKDQFVVIPIAAQYITGAMKVLISLSLVAAAVMLVYGGFLYVVSGIGLKAKKEGKQVIVDALIGLVIALGSYLILANINPNTLRLDAIRVPYVKTELIEMPPQTQNAVASASSFYNAKDSTAAPDEVYAKAREIAEKEGVDPCIVEAIIYTESRGKIGVVGHDENFNFVAAGVKIPQARINFLRSRKFYSGKDFDAPTPGDPDDKWAVMPTECTGAARDTCLRVSKKGPLNDDLNINPADPYLGLDHRDGFSHGFGISQLTLWPNDQCNGKWGKQISGKCFSPQDLLTLEGGVRAILAHPAFKPGASPEAVFKAYIGAPNPGLEKLKMAAYQSCKKKLSK